MSKYTPGPWHAYIGGNFVNVVADGYEEWVERNSYSAGPLMIAEMNYRASDDYGNTPAQAIANARLIAAAPELLEACHEVKNFLANLENGTRRDDPLYGLRLMFHKPLHAVLDSAIAKAEVLAPENNKASAPKPMRDATQHPGQSSGPTKGEGL